MESIARFNVKLNTPTDVKFFVYKAQELPRNISIKVMHDDYVIDGKSILGLLSLDLSNSIIIEIKSNENIDFSFIEKFDEWRVE